MKQIDWSKTLDSRGNIRETKVYIQQHNVPPSTHQIQLEKSLDLQKAYIIAKDCFSDSIITIAVGDNNDYEYISLATKGLLQPYAFIDIYTDDFICTIYETEIRITANAEFDIETFKKTFVEKLPELKKERNKTIELVAYNNGFYTIPAEIKGCEINIKENYNDDFTEVYDTLQKFILDRECGLTILHGEKGSGKTMLIRHLITTIDKQFVFIPQNVADHIGDPEFTSFLLDHKNSIFIIEDCEQILIKRETNFINNTGIATILNMSDGLLSDIFNIKFIFTFNSDIENIDPALLRKGRCFVNYEFDKLSKDKSNALLEKLGYRAQDKEMSLAEIYNFTNINHTEKTNRNKIGF